MQTVIVCSLSLAKNALHSPTCLALELQHTMSIPSSVVKHNIIASPITIGHLIASSLDKPVKTVRAHTHAHCGDGHPLASKFHSAAAVLHYNPRRACAARVSSWFVCVCYHVFCH